jgi:protein-tyrosine phosphatase
MKNVPNQRPAATALASTPAASAFAKATSDRDARVAPACGPGSSWALGNAEILKIVLLLLLFPLAQLSGSSDADVRPPTWSQPAAGTALKNLYRVSDELYRSEQPKMSDIPALKSLGIRSILSLRTFHSDSKEFERQGIVMYVCPMEAGSVTAADLVVALRILKVAPKPVVVHCWHGSDRTGLVIAAYRMIWQNWTVEKAIQEMREGGYGFHEVYLKHIVQVLAALDIHALRKELTEGASQVAVPSGLAIICCSLLPSHVQTCLLFHQGIFRRQRFIAAQPGHHRASQTDR